MHKNTLKKIVKVELVHRKLAGITIAQFQYFLHHCSYNYLDAASDNTFTILKSHKSPISDYLSCNETFTIDSLPSH